MTKPPMRTVVAATAGVAVYYALLALLSANAPYTAAPHWWHQLVPSSAIAVTVWFTLLNVSVAILAAVPVAFGLMRTIPVPNIRLGLVIGAVPAIYIVGGGLVEFGVPRTFAAWGIDAAQFLAVALAVVIVQTLFWRRPLTNAWSGRES